MQAEREKGGVHVRSVPSTEALQKKFTERELFLDDDLKSERWRQNRYLSRQVTLPPSGQKAVFVFVFDD